MGLHQIDGAVLVRMLTAGCAYLARQKDRVDALNVFPVPDGDTGTNMYLTLLSAVKEAEKADVRSGKLGKSISMGALMGARGNSGVILSQIFRGFARELDGKKAIDAKQFAAALQAGSDTAYKAVMKPVEGTILTVIREIARGAAASAAHSDEIEVVFGEALEAGRRILEKTPSMLPILKEAGVVDAGGQGLIYFLEGMYSVLTGVEPEEIPMEPPKPTAEITPTEQEAFDPKYPYCTEVLISGSKLDQDQVRRDLLPMGDCLLVVGESNLLKIHIHSASPGRVLEICLRRGILHDIKINNMADEIEERTRNLAAGSAPQKASAMPQPMKKVGVVAVSQGDGWQQILSSLGVDKVIEGGQTMNPSTQDFLDAINAIPAETIILLPNNKNVILAAQQAADVSEKPVEVVPTTSTMQAIAALVVYEPDGHPAENAEAMRDDIKRVRTGEVTVAVRDAGVNGLQIKNGDYIGLIEDKVILIGTSEEETVMQLLEKLAAEGDLITIYYGKEITAQEAEALREKVETAYDAFEVELHYGGQPYYHYQLSVE
ncbi:MAG: DAK2 domain-containing protein [Solirubrobacterales bacterium]